MDFISVLSQRGWEETNNNVNRRFAGSELNPFITVDDDETK